MNKIISVGTLLVFILALLLSGCQIKQQNDNTISNNSNTINDKGDKNQVASTIRGNSIGNIANGGYVAAKGDWVYYYDNKKASIYKTSMDETESLIKEAGVNLNIVDNWIIYTSEIDRKIYRASLDGSKIQKLSDEVCDFLNVIGEWAFYVNESDKNSIYKMKIDGSEKTKLNNVGSARINVVGEWIYYCRLKNETSEEFGESYYYPFGEIYKLKVDGSEELKVSSVKASFLNVVDNWIYYSDINDGVALYKMKTDGSQVSKVVDDNCYYVNVTEDTLFYSDMSSSFYKTDLNGKNKVLLGEHGRYMNICLVNEWIYFKLWSGNETDFYKMKLNGTNKIKVSSTKDEQKDSQKVTKEAALKYISDTYVGDEGLTIEDIADSKRYGISWANPGGVTGGYWEVDTVTGDVFSAMGSKIGNIFESE